MVLSGSNLGYGVPAASPPEQDLIGAVLRRTRRLARRLWSRLTRPASPPRSATPYATHIPVLAAVSEIFHIVRVVEFGSGLDSTPAFLDATAFPNIVKLTSFENNTDWWHQVNARVGHDPRVEMRQVTGQMSESVSSADFEHADLILIDDSECAADRCATIRKVQDCVSAATLVLIHDFEVEDYRDAASFPHRFVFDAVNPHTGVLSGAPLPMRRLRRFNRLISRWIRRGVVMDDLPRWKRVLSRTHFGPNRFWFGS